MDERLCPEQADVVTHYNVFIPCYFYPSFVTMSFDSNEERQFCIKNVLFCYFSYVVAMHHITFF